MAGLERTRSQSCNRASSVSALWKLALSMTEYMTTNASGGFVRSSSSCKQRTSLPIRSTATVHSFIHSSVALQHFVGPWSLFFFSFVILYTVGRTSWMGDQPVARLLPTHRTTQTQNKHTDFHALSGIRNHDPSVKRAKTVHAVHALVRAVTVIGLQLLYRV
jgi:hypothetical protein